MKRLMRVKKVNVIGAGLAGCEAAWQIANRGIEVNLYEMKPIKYSPAHKSENFAELVCSNSFKAERIESAAGLLKQEMRMLNSLIVECADNCRVPAGGALAVDRDKFSCMVTEKIKSHRNINVINKEIEKISFDDVNIVATGPLTSDKLAKEIEKICGGALSFFDAAAPIITADSVDMSKAFFDARYGRGEKTDYLNCPLSETEYKNFYAELLSAERAPIHDFDVYNPKVYEGCMPVEVAAQRGEDTLRYGPMKPVGLRDSFGNKPYAVIQLRKENLFGTLYNMVGFQTNLKFQEQKRVFSLVPALKNVEIVRYGVMHRNTFIDSPRLLNKDYSMRKNENLFFAGQITGVEGYMESTSSGLVAGLNVALMVKGSDKIVFPNDTVIGALAEYISDENVVDFQPMGANFGILSPLENQIRDKKLRYRALAERAIQRLRSVGEV